MVDNPNYLIVIIIIVVLLGKILMNYQSNCIRQSIEIIESCKWMTNRLILGRRECTNEFIMFDAYARCTNEFIMFDAYARFRSMFLKEDRYRCPCLKCKNKKYLTPNDVKVHLIRGALCILIGIELHMGRLSQQVHHSWPKCGS